MKRNIVLIIGLFIASTIVAQSQKKVTEHFTAKYPSEVEEYATASLFVLEATWSIANHNGYYLPEHLKFSIKQSDRNAIYFNRKNLKEIVWEYRNISEMLPPDKSGKNNIYGLCHEIGHLCMYNTTHNRNNWMSYDYREAWADYFGNVIIDSLYEEFGINIWPEPHDFKKYGGIEYFLSRIEKNNPKLKSFNNAGLFWFEIGSEIGFNSIPEFFNSVQVEKVNNPNAEGKFVEILEGIIPKPDVKSWFDQFSEDLIINME